MRIFSFNAKKASADRQTLTVGVEKINPDKMMAERFNGWTQVKSLASSWATSM